MRTCLAASRCALPPGARRRLPPSAVPPVLRLLDFTRRPPVADAAAPPPDADDIALVGRLALDDAQALGQLLERYWAPMVAFAMERVRSQDAAEDLVQEAFVRVWERRLQLRPEASPRAYLYRVLRNLIIDEYRRRRLRDRFTLFKGMQEPPEVPTPAATLEADEFKGAAQRAIAALPERRREVFVLAHLHGLSYKEVAEALGITPRTVANHMTLALGQLREALAGYTGGRGGGGARTLPFVRRARVAAAEAPVRAPVPEADADPPLGAPSS
jgi:RNA polymerase sigma-70 factor (ECF subfamily)